MMKMIRYLVTYVTLLMTATIYAVTAFSSDNGQEGLTEIILLEGDGINFIEKTKGIEGEIVYLGEETPILDAINSIDEIVDATVWAKAHPLNTTVGQAATLKGYHEMTLKNPYRSPIRYRVEIKLENHLGNNITQVKTHDIPGLGRKDASYNSSLRHTYTQAGDFTIKSRTKVISGIVKPTAEHQARARVLPQLISSS